MPKPTTIVLTLALTASIGLNIGIMTVQSVALAVSTAADTVGLGSKLLPAFKSVVHRGEKRLVNDLVRETTSRVAKRTLRGTTRTAASVFGESIPFVGVAVVVGVAGWELKDACDNLKDLHALDLALNPDGAIQSDVDEVCGLKVPSKEEVWAFVKASPGDAWDAAKATMPDLPAMPDLNTMPEMPDLSSWSFWQ